MCETMPDGSGPERARTLRLPTPVLNLLRYSFDVARCGSAMKLEVSEEEDDDGTD
jgi:hypothetical protein